MYSTVLWLHSYWRWVVVFVVAAALAHALLGYRRGWPFASRARGLQRAFVGTLDLQLLLGLVLYVFLSPYTRAAFADLGQALKNPHYRFFAVEHAAVQLIAVVVAHVGKVRVERAPTDARRHKRAIVYAAIVLVLITIAIPWPGLDIGRPLLR
jgi:hypothetical protein